MQTLAEWAARLMTRSDSDGALSQHPPAAPSLHLPRASHHRCGRVWVTVVVWACGLALRAWDSLEVVAEELRAGELQAGAAGDLFKLGYYAVTAAAAQQLPCGAGPARAGPSLVTRRPAPSTRNPPEDS